jgi:hypothetical protein
MREYKSENRKHNSGSNIPNKSIQRKNDARYLEDNRPNIINKKNTNTTGLPDTLKNGIENLSGVDMSDTKVHYNSSKPAQLNAHAYAQGTDIHLASGQEKHLPHEAWHVVQQKQGRVKPTMQMKGKVNVDDDEGLEKEADVMGAKALQMKSSDSPKSLNDHTVINQDRQPIQRRIILKNGYDTKSIETLHQLRLWLDKAGYEYNRLRKYLPEMINDINGDIELSYPLMFGQRYYMNHLMETVKTDQTDLDSLEAEFRDVDSEKQQGFRQRFDIGLKNPQYIEDWNLNEIERELYTNVHAFLLDPELVFKVLNEINNFVSNIGPDKLSGEEWHQELLGGLANDGIEQNPEELKSLLTADEFLEQTTGIGVLPLDTGADLDHYKKPVLERKTEARYGPRTDIPKHGALSHTIQWLIIQEGLKKSPQLLSLIDMFKNTAVIKRTHENTPALWSSLVDMPPVSGFVLNATMPEGLTTLINEFFPAIKAVEDQIEAMFLMELAGNGETVYRQNGRLVRSMRAPGGVKNKFPNIKL